MVRQGMTSESIIHSFHSVLPSSYRKQPELNEWVLRYHQKTGLPETELHSLSKYCLSENHIEGRYLECDEVDDEWEGHEIYLFPKAAGIEKRNRYYGEKVKRVFEQFYRTQDPTHIIHVTCTGYLSPSPPQVHFSGKDNSPYITHAYHMGCYASLPAVRMARGLQLSEANTIDIVHTELCSLHLNHIKHTPEQIVVQSLFSDGHIKYSVGESREGLKILGIHEKLIPESLDDMTWIPSEFGMSMTLSREVPYKIRDELSLFMEELANCAGTSKNKLLKDAIFAVHPGGPLIVEAVQKKLELSSSQVEFSHKILRTRGNMSSATLPHVWKAIWDSGPRVGEKIVSLAFGPGLTIFGAVFEVKA